MNNGQNVPPPPNDPPKGFGPGSSEDAGSDRDARPEVTESASNTGDAGSNAESSMPSAPNFGLKNRAGSSADTSASGSKDAGSTDAGSTDAGSTDVGSTDAGDATVAMPSPFSSDAQNPRSATGSSSSESRSDESRGEAPENTESENAGSEGAGSEAHDTPFGSDAPPLQTGTPTGSAAETPAAPQASDSPWPAPNSSQQGPSGAEQGPPSSAQGYGNTPQESPSPSAQGYGSAASAPQYGGAQQNQDPQQGGPYQNSPYQNSPYQSAPYPGGAATDQNSGGYGTNNDPYQSGPQRTGSGPGSNQAIPQPAPAPGYAAAAPATTRAEARPANKKSKLPLFIALGAVLLVLVLVLVGFLVVNSVNKNNYGPDKVAEDYVAALNKGDFAGAEKIAPSPRPEGTNVDLLSKNFTEASSAKIENAKVESSTVDGDNGTVVISYEFDGTSYNVDLTAKKDGKQNLFFDKWALTGPALHVISLDIPGADGLAINGTEYQAQSGTTAFAVYPGNYEFTIAKSKWIAEASDVASANFPQAYAAGEQPSSDPVSPLTLNLELSPTPEFEKEVQKKVDEELKKCFDNKTIKAKCKFLKFDPSEAPISGSDKKLSDLAKDGTAKWEVKSMPKVKASFGLGDTNTGSFFTEKNGSFDFKVDGKEAGSSYFLNGNVLSVSGSVKIEGDKLTVEFFDF